MKSGKTFRSFRRWIAAQAVAAGRSAAPMLPDSAISAAEWTMRGLSPHLPILASLVAGNMRSAGVYSESAIHDYFAQVSLHLANGLRVFRWTRRPERVTALARSQIDLDATIDFIRDAHAAGRGAIVAPAHTCNYVLTLARLAQAVPICIYLRWSNDRRKVEMKKKWCQAAGIHVVLEPPSATNPTSRAAACVEVLKAGGILAMTPDIAQKDQEGVEVTLLDRRIGLPTGAASIAMLAESPLIPLFGRLAGSVQHLYAESPIIVEHLSRAEGGRQTAVKRAMQQWTNGFERFLRECPAVWFLWADSRWTRVFRNDPRYVAGETSKSQSDKLSTQEAGGIA
jgi:lauroyl/myristoyl acyltransferase